MKKNQPNRIQEKNKGEVRIIAGLWRARKLPVLNSTGLRPTGDRVKETLFNWLMPHIVDSNCLDCFAGSGSLGFEALSRQAKNVTFLELDKTIANQLNKNVAILKCTNANVINQNSLHYLNKTQTEPHFDIVFIDPPFYFNLAEQAIKLLVQHNWLHANALIYVETEREKTLTTPANWQLLKEKNTKQVSYRLYQHLSPSI
ncbi:16S rRNA (guanine(966)-N(2))-methyltransferase RsmD [Histophilus somni]|uniref:Ribosomal RNA small subunit methyltransferase D n=2 Tax=Histophilus somni TaxID=731 RepID=A0A9Q7E7P2_HISSO|nr:16S rRNA (guanine(966)-N(2))-methyltransferase RsmD [Histophilus somni]ARU65353.1 16S rRNA (guanine(966)-N(2))-methyltransferase RsmD [Histophilus somni]ARU67220.1 16S rRNA (guanine(966)-N(2))-methyltransferase RsmD [Histophilus somni]ARU69097.1 16S rRNA (guanine(966)-N(2))-methyltransferase RsmD [Histophilus somni]ARU70975.1 16S rRNA (guanine(966)-N(2))-methyltransferase RsmD [Histophilus somni]ARU72847.1 16S rRNA (guanine(966)-N(2))-methyltransferase RsmD [Histophilus somni]